MLEFKRSKPSSTRPNKPSVDGFVPRSSRVPGESQTTPSARPAAKTRPEGFSYSPRLQNEFKNTPPVVAAPLTATKLSNEPRRSSKPKKHRFSVGSVFKLAGASLGILFVAGLLIGGFVFGKAWLTAHKIFQGGGNSAVLFSTEIQPEKLRGEGDGRVNVLLVGIGGGDRAGAYLTDSIVIASIDPIAKDVALLSIPRDLWVDVPDYWSMKINAAYSSARERALDNGSAEKEASEAGFSALERTIENNIGIPIHYHALVNFQAFKDGVDAVGGVDVNVPEDLYDYVLAGENGGDPLLARAGLQHFDGRQALLYAQSRYSSSDFARGQRQRELIIAMKDKVLAAGTFSNPNTVSRLLDAFGDNVTVNASLSEIMRMYEIGKDIPSTSIVSVGFTDEPNVLVKTGNINDQSVVIPRAGQGDFSEIQTFVRNTLRDPFLKSENATIAVLNGTATEGLATLKADELSSYGYNVIIVDSAPTQDYAQTVIYDRTNNQKRYTRNYLENRIGAKVTSEPADNPIAVEADFVIVLGQNETSNSSN
jgi:polyisoprenyl-teichoic acid--peptidoglycan teichoic acid transferase